MRIFKMMLAAAAPGALLATLWWFLSPETFAGSQPTGLYTSIGIGFIAGMGLIYFVLPDWFE